jgi:5,10-methylene-tetrahydrofolate dehydrogenase/methenyl tetrahydrofolate cyclohydrolase
VDSIIVDGKKLSEEVLDNLKYFFKENKAAIAAISVGNKEKGEIFIRQKQKVANNLNIDFFHFHFDENISNNKLRKKLTRLVKIKI